VAGSPDRPEQDSRSTVADASGAAVGPDAAVTGVDSEANASHGGAPQGGPAGSAAQSGMLPSTVVGAAAGLLSSLASSAKSGTQVYGSFYGSARLFSSICGNKVRRIHAAATVIKMLAETVQVRILTVAPTQ
jgi:hypothetical protein